MIFISYNSKDFEIVHNIVGNLKNIDSNLNLFTDRSYLVSGNPCLETIENTLKACSICVIFYGLYGLGPWQEREN